MSTALKISSGQYAAVFEHITPQIAATYLENNHSNRPIRQGMVKHLATEISLDKWKTNGDTIKFSIGGRLLDGQHRLLACIEANLPISAYVVRGLDETVFDTIDQGAKRNARDILSCAGEINCTTLGRVLTLLWKLDNDCLGGARVPNNRERIEALRANPAARDSVNYAISLNIQHIVTASTIAFLHFIGIQIDKQKTCAFLEAVSSGANLETGHPALMFREVALRERNATRSKQHRRDEMEAYGVKALQAYFDGRLFTRYLHYKSTEKFPQLMRPPEKTVDKAEPHA